MKKVFWLVVIFILVLGSITQALAQKGLGITENQKLMSQGVQSSFSILLPNIESTKEIDKAWTKYIKDFKGGKTKRNKKSGEIFSDNMKLERISNNTVDVYAKTLKTQAGVELTVWFDLGGAFLATQTHTEKAVEADAILLKFGLNVINMKDEDALKVEEKALKALNKDAKKLESDYADYNKEINKLKEKIQKLEEQKKQNRVALEQKQEAIEAQKQRVQIAKDKVQN